MTSLIEGVDRDEAGLVTGEAAMLVEQCGKMWWDVEHDAPIKAVRYSNGSTYIVGEDLDWDGPCFGGEFLLNDGEAERVGMPVTVEA